jgi:hypothetical protein
MNGGNMPSTASSVQERRPFAAHEGARVAVILVDGSCLEDCELVSAGRGAAETVWIVSDNRDMILPLADVVDVRPSDILVTHGT